MFEAAVTTPTVDETEPSFSEEQELVEVEETTKEASPEVQEVEPEDSVKDAWDVSSDEEEPSEGR